MNDKGLAAGIAHLLDEGLQEFVGVLLVDADTGLDRHRNVHHVAHRLDAIGHQGGLPHQTGAEAAILDAIRRATHVEVDLVIATLFGQPRTAGQIRRVAASQLQGERVFLLAVAQIISLAVDDGAGGHHLGIEQGLAGHQTVEITAMPIGPVQHGGNRECLAVGRLARYGLRA